MSQHLSLTVGLKKPRLILLTGFSWLLPFGLHFSAWIHYSDVNYLHSLCTSFTLTCWIFQLVFGCCALQMLVEIYFSTRAVPKSCKKYVFCVILTKFFGFLYFFYIFHAKNMKKHILTSVLSAQPPNTGQHIQPWLSKKRTYKRKNILLFFYNKRNIIY